MVTVNAIQFPLYIGGVAQLAPWDQDVIDLVWFLSLEFLQVLKLLLQSKKVLAALKPCSLIRFRILSPFSFL
jgi:hypothetical protein